MIRGTTAPFKFEIPYPFSDICRIQAVFWQNGNEGTAIAPLPIVKEYNIQLDPVRNDGFAQGSTENEICISLTPEETLRFSDQMKGYAQIQARCDIRHITFASKEQRFAVYPIHNESAMEEIGQPSGNNDNIQILDAGEIA